MGWDPFSDPHALSRHTISVLLKLPGRQIWDKQRVETNGRLTSLPRLCLGCPRDSRALVSSFILPQTCCRTSDRAIPTGEQEFINKAV